MDMFMFHGAVQQKRQRQLNAALETMVSICSRFLVLSVYRQ